MVTYLYSKFKNSHTQLEDDVYNETVRLSSVNLAQQAKEEQIIVHDLCKVFKKKVQNQKVKMLAVNHLSFGVAPTECFG